MKTTLDFVKTMKIAFVLVLLFFIYSFALSYFGMHGISISHPQENTDLRLALNKLNSFLVILSFWLLIGYLCKNYKAAIIAMIVTMALNFGLDLLFPKEYTSTTTTKGIKYYLIAISGILPYLAFGFIYFKSPKALKLIIYWAIIWGLSVTLDTRGFERMVEGLTRIFGWRDIFEIHIPTSETGYRPISILRLLTTELFLIVRLAVFWWVIQFIQSKKSFWNYLHTFYDSAANDRFSFSILYWSFRIILFVAGFGLISFMAMSFRFPFDLMRILRILMATFALIVTAAIYRNMLVSHFAQNNKYPAGTFFLLNVPVINCFAWLYMIINFNAKPKDQEQTSQIKNNLPELKSSFIENSRNGGWKIIIILMTLFSMLYQLNRAGLRIDGPSRDGAYTLLMTSLVALILVLWFLYNKHAYIPLIVISCIGIIITVLLRNEAFLYPTLASSLINIMIFYGLFYFDELKWETSDELKGTDISLDT